MYNKYLVQPIHTINELHANTGFKVHINLKSSNKAINIIHTESIEISKDPITFYRIQTQKHNLEAKRREVFLHALK